MNGKEIGIPTISIEELAAQYGLDDLSLYNPGGHAEKLVTRLEEEDIFLELADDNFQSEAKNVVSEMTDRIQSEFGEHFKDRHRAILSGIHNEVVVVTNLIAIRKESGNLQDLSDLPEKGFLVDFLLTSEIIKLKIDTYGAVVPTFSAVLLSDAIFQEDFTEEQREVVVAHELMHVLGENNFPMLLDEAATDFYAQRLVGSGDDQKHRMTWNYPIVYGIWGVTHDLVGEEAAMEGYLEPAVVAETYDENTGVVISKSLEYVSYHDELHKMLGEDKKGVSNWVKTVEYLEQKKALSAARIFYPAAIRYSVSNRFSK